MALINCKECGKEVSTEAKVCPHCGFKQPKKSAWPIAAIFIIAIIAFGNHLLSAPSESPEVHAEKYKQAWAECSKIIAKITLSGNGTGRENAENAINAGEDCMSSRGFTVKLRN